MSANVQTQRSLPDNLREHIRWILAAGIVAGAVLPLGSATTDSYFYSRTQSIRLLGGGGALGDWVVVLGLIVSLVLVLRNHPDDKRQLGASLIIPSLGWSLGPCLMTLLGGNTSSGLLGDSRSFSPGLGWFAIVLTAAIASYVGFGLMQQTTSSNNGIVFYVGGFIVATWMAGLIVFTLLIWLGFNGLVSFPAGALAIFAVLGAGAVWAARAGWSMIEDAESGEYAGVRSYQTYQPTSLAANPIIRATHAKTIGSCKMVDLPTSTANIVAILPAGITLKLLENPTWMPRQQWISVLDERSGQKGYVDGFAIQAISA